MRKTFKTRLLTTCISAGLIVASVNVLNPQASTVKYDDSNVSILAAIDNYVETNEYAFSDLEVTLKAEAEKKEEKTVALNAEKPKYEGTTGSIKTVAAEPTEETTEEPTTEQVAEETPDDETDNESVGVSYYDFSGKALVTASGSVNIRSGASTDNSIVGTIGNAGLMDVSEMGDEWSLVSSGNVSGYIKNEFVAFGDDADQYAKANLEQMAVINASTLSLRESADVNSECLSLLPNGESYHIKSIGDAWTEIQVDDTLSGYVSNEFIYIGYNTSVATPEDNYSDDSDEDSEDDSDDSNDNETDDSNDEDTEESTPEPEGSTDVPASSTGVDIANFALKYVGYPYVYGGTSLTEGADCSGFVMRVFEHFGYQLPRTADVQATVGTPISLAALAPGDLLFYDHGSGSIQHVAIYIGDGQIVHASNSISGIIVSNAYYSTPCKAVRIAN